MVLGWPIKKEKLFAEFWFVKSMGAMLILGVVLDFEMIFTSDFFKSAWQNEEFVS